MNQEEIGKFILELRKEKQMTQQELADKIGVTDRAISKWENGRGMPDLSLLKPLCQELDISVNELLNGQRLDQTNYQDKAEETVYKTIDYTQRRMKKSKKIFNVIIFTIFFSFLLLVTIFLFDVRQMNQNKAVIFSTWGFDYTPPVDMHDEEIKIAIKDYLATLADNETKHYDTEKAFASMKVYLIDEKESNLYYVYAWVYLSKYYLENDTLKESSGYSIPHKFTVENKNGDYVVTESVIPRDGSYYADDMKKIFPRSVCNDMDSVHDDGTVRKLNLEVLEQAKLYFHK